MSKNQEILNKAKEAIKIIEENNLQDRLISIRCDFIYSLEDYRVIVHLEYGEYFYGILNNYEFEIDNDSHVGLDDLRKIGDGIEFHCLVEKKKGKL